MSYVAIPLEDKYPNHEHYFRIVAYRPDGTFVDAPASAVPTEKGSIQNRQGDDGKNFPVYYEQTAARVLNYLHGGDGKELPKN